MTGKRIQEEAATGRSIRRPKGRIQHIPKNALPTRTPCTHHLFTPLIPQAWKSTRGEEPTVPHAKPRAGVTDQPFWAILAPTPTIRPRCWRPAPIRPLSEKPTTFERFRRTEQRKGEERSRVGVVGSHHHAPPTSFRRGPRVAGLGLDLHIP